jgi:hypothetical protein
VALAEVEKTSIAPAVASAVNSRGKSRCMMSS